MSQVVWAGIAFVYAAMMAVFALCLWRQDRQNIQQGTGWSLGFRAVVVAAVFLSVIFLICGVKILCQDR